jgi:hypothetical protein
MQQLAFRSLSALIFLVPWQEIAIMLGLAKLERLIAEVVGGQADRWDGSCDALEKEPAWTR